MSFSVSYFGIETVALAARIYLALHYIYIIMYLETDVLMFYLMDHTIGPQDLYGPYGPVLYLETDLLMFYFMDHTVGP